MNPPAKKPRGIQDPTSTPAVAAPPTPVMAPPTRDPLPPRAKCVTNPGAPDKPAARRTSEEVTAAQRRQAELEAELIELDAKRIAAVAKLRVERLLADAEEDKNVVRCLSDLQDSDAEGAEGMLSLDLREDSKLICPE
ncbi:hypothetical protein JAAARDRAFT_60680 [Jaapia argillacea MUCL 33604]|uniref:Uncharacterized protein n=1 Tax=Jaapia argillacea MUCL 33604 TaxID=933084 RepID=A0A067PK91_9AGAM|nr:hypothetical protein JAAARDRAFT_60680 [Jaapia argillacea MUCL 33604]